MQIINSTAVMKNSEALTVHEMIKSYTSLTTEPHHQVHYVHKTLIMSTMSRARAKQFRIHHRHIYARRGQSLQCGRVA